jgi:hypothetical protein
LQLSLTYKLGRQFIQKKKKTVLTSVCPKGAHAWDQAYQGYGIPSVLQPPELKLQDRVGRELTMSEKRIALACVY